MLMIGPHLGPLQFGGGLSHGAGIGVRIGGLFLQREGFSVMSVDIENAFNSTRHRVIYDSLRLYYPSLIPFSDALSTNTPVLWVTMLVSQLHLHALELDRVTRGAPFSSSLPSNPLFSWVRRREGWMASSKLREPHGSSCPTPVRVDATVIPALLRIELGCSYLKRKKGIREG